MMPDYQCVTRMAVASSRLPGFVPFRCRIVGKRCKKTSFFCTVLKNLNKRGKIRPFFTPFCSLFGYGIFCCQVVQYGGTQSHANRIRLKTEWWSREPYGSEWWLTTEVTLITSVVAAHSLNLAETYSLVSPYFDKSDNLHFNGDYHKMLACSHFVWINIRKAREQSRPCCSTPSVVWGKIKKQTSLLGKRCLLLLVAFLIHTTLQR